MFFWIADKRAKAHTNNEHRKISKRNGNRMTYSEIGKFLKTTHLHIFFPGNNRIRTYACTEQFGIVVVMMIVRSFPDAGRRQHVNTKNGHDYFSRFGFG